MWSDMIYFPKEKQQKEKKPHKIKGKRKSFLKNNMESMDILILDASIIRYVLMKLLLSN